MDQREGILIFGDSKINAMVQYRWPSSCPDRVCSFLMPNLTILINAFFENLMHGRDPDEVVFNTTGCFDIGPYCGGWAM